jgi:hypothetical protein
MVNYSLAVLAIASAMGVEVSLDWTGIDSVWPILEKMKSDGSVIIIDMQGHAVNDAKPAEYVASALGRLLGNDPIRVSSPVLQQAATELIVQYASRVWGIQVEPNT